MGGIAGLVSWGPPLEPDALKPLINAAGQRSRDGIHHPNTGTHTSFAHLKIADTNWVTTHGIHTTNNLIIATDSRLDDRTNLTKTLGLPTNSPDPHILEAAHNKWGNTLAQHLTGDYAFAIYNRDTQTLTAARDPFSMRSLHWTRTPNGIAIASDAAQLLAHPNITKQPNLNTLAAYIHGLPPTHTETFWENIETIPPGHTTTITQHTHNHTRHWQINPEHTIRYKNTREYTDHCQHLLTTAINDRLTNTPHTTGLSLSGGVDSTTVATLAAHQNHTLNTYSFTFTQPHLQDSDETHISTPLAQHLGHPNTLIPADHLGPLAVELRQLVDEPAASPFAEVNVAVLQVSATAGDRILITCDRGDSLFGGSSHSAIRQLVEGRHQALRDLVATGDVGQIIADALSAARRRLRRPSSSSAAMPSWLDSIPLRAGSNDYGGNSRIDWILDDVAQQISAWSDRSWASAGLRFVDPFSSTALAEFAAAVPSSVLSAPGIPDKRLLQTMVAPLMPAGVGRPIKTSLAPLFLHSTQVPDSPLQSGVGLQALWPRFSAQAFRTHMDRYLQSHVPPGRLAHAVRALHWYQSLDLADG